jgi:hypothetical protein
MPQVEHSSNMLQTDAQAKDDHAADAIPTTLAVA